jgi:hypothetical protein
MNTIGGAIIIIAIGLIIAVIAYFPILMFVLIFLISSIGIGNIFFGDH